MRILFVSLIPSYWGGSEVLWSQAATALAAGGHQVNAFFAMFREAPQIDALQAGGVQLAYGTTPPLRWWRRLVHRPRPTRALWLETLRQSRPDLVVFSQCAVRDGITEMLDCAEQGVPYAVINQLVEPLDYPEPKRGEIGRAYRAARRLWFVSPENLESVSRYLGGMLPRAYSVPNAYACAYQCERPWPAAAEPLRLALVARLEPEQKGHDLVIAALAGPAWRDRAVRVSFFGHGPGRDSLAALCRQHGVEDRIVFAGTASPGCIWADHHAALMPSRYEGQSLSMLEAMLHGRPVIATPVGGTRGLVINGETGFLGARADAAAVAEVLETAWQQRATWRTLGRAAARQARAHVSPDSGATMAERILTAATSPLS